ncbi:hypothetical protein ACHAXT_009407 [Thalassiosira profunda]
MPSAAPAAAAGDDGCVALTIPPGAQPGDVLTVEHGGQTVEAVVPEEARPGDTIQIEFVLEGAGAVGDGTARETETLVLTVPPGATPGEVLALDFEGRKVEFVVPEGAAPGDEIEVNPEELAGAGDANRTSDDGRAPRPAPEGDAAVTTEEREDGSVVTVTKTETSLGDGTVRTVVVTETRHPDGRIEIAEEEWVKEAAPETGAPAEIGASSDDGASPEPIPGTVDLVMPADIEPGVLLQFEAADGRTFTIPIPEGTSAGDVLTIKLPAVADKDDEKSENESVGDVTVEERDDGTIVKTTKDDRGNGTIITTIETSTLLPDGSRKVETETIVEKPRKHKSLREKREAMLEFRRRAEEEEAERKRQEGVEEPSKPKPKPTPKELDERTAQLMLSDADDFYNAGEIRAAGRYTYNAGVVTTGASSSEKEAEEANPYMPGVQRNAQLQEWYKAPEPKEKIDVEESRIATMARSAVVTKFEEDRAAVFDEEGNERPTPQLIIALEAAAIVTTRKAEPGGNARLDALVAKDAKRLTVNVR